MASKPLTKQLIISKTRSESLQLLKNLNLWGHDLDDMQVLETLPNLEVLVLSVNKISTLKDFANLQNLRELYLRKNEISDICEIQHLMNLPKLKILWMDENPIEKHPNYRNILLKILPNLIKLDNTEVSHEERQKAANSVDMNAIFNSPQQQQQQQQQNYPPTNYQSPVKEQEQQQKPSYHKQNSNPVYNDNQQQQQFDILQQQQQQYQQQQQQYESNNISQNNSNMFNPNFHEMEKSIQQQFQAQQDQLQNYNQYAQNQNQIQQKAMTTQGMEQRNENVVCAILSLMKDLDESSLEIIRRNAEKKIGNLRIYNR